MAIDAIGAGPAIPPTPRAADSLAPAPVDEVRQVAGHLAVAAEANPQAAEAQVQAALQADRQRQDSAAADRQRPRPHARGSIVDIDV